MIFYIIYLSSTTGLLSESDLADILSVSRINNTAKDITGLLLHNDGNILQVLEGNEETVMNVFFKIEKDSRHRGIIKMLSGTSSERNFPDWSMGYKKVSGDKWDDLSACLKMNHANVSSKSLNNNEMIDTVVSSYMEINVN